MGEENELIMRLIEEKKYHQLKQILSEMNEVDIAEILDPIDPSITLLIFRMLPKDLAVEVFAHFSTDQQREIVEGASDKELKYILNELFFDDMIDLIEEMPANIVNKILINSREDERQLINQFLKYPEDSAGSLMTIEYVELRQAWTVKESLAHIKEIGLTKETIYTCYVTDKDRKLEGFVSLRTLVTANEDSIIRDIMEDEVISVNTHDDQETVAQGFRKYGFLAIPVVDNEYRLTGIITVDDIMDVMEQEATEDFQLMAAMSPSEEDYLDTSVIQLAKHRLPWLLILMISGVFTARIMGKYEDILSSVVLLSAFIPMLMDTGGNSGSQSSTLIIRGLAIGEIKLSDGWKVLWKEFRISFLVGIVLAFVNFVRLMTFDKVPLIAKRMKLDPAIMAGPLITTIVDGLSLAVYFTLATKLLSL